MEIIKQNHPDVINKAVEVLSNGGIIIYPTETCYGVGVDATNPEAVAKVLEYKKRPQGKPISVGVSSKDMADKYVEINESAQNIYNEFLPGPVTVVSRSKGKIDKSLESENGNLGIRIPNYDLLIQIIEKFGKPITTTSANSAGKKTPYEVKDILDNVTNKQLEMIDLIIDAGELPKNLTSTVIDTTTADLKTHRSGKISFNKKIQKTYQTNKVEETIELGEQIMLKNNDNDDQCLVFLLSGELGAGKTHFTKGIAKALDIQRTIKSPTYGYVNEYKMQSGIFYHVDAWRIENKNDLELLRFKDWIKPGNVIVIEWPEIILNLAGENIFNNCKLIDLEIKVVSDKIRKFILYEIENE